jgi:hypothetical protein
MLAAQAAEDEVEVTLYNETPYVTPVPLSGVAVDYDASNASTIVMDDDVDHPEWITQINDSKGYWTPYVVTAPGSASYGLDTVNGLNVLRFPGRLENRYSQPYNPGGFVYQIVMEQVTATGSSWNLLFRVGGYGGPNVSFDTDNWFANSEAPEDVIPPVIIAPLRPGEPEVFDIVVEPGEDGALTSFRWNGEVVMPPTVFSTYMMTFCDGVLLGYTAQDTTLLCQVRVLGLDVDLDEADAEMMEKWGVTP